MSKSTVFEKFVKGTPFAFRKISDFSKRDPLYGNPIQKVAIALSKFHVFSSPKIRIFSTKCTVKLDSRFRSIENLDRARFSNLEISDLSRSRISRNFEISESRKISRKIGLTVHSQYDLTFYPTFFCNKLLRIDPN